jgi:hypothetical protein
MSTRSLARACFALIAAVSLCVTTLAAAKEPPPKRKRPALLTLRDLASGKLLPVTSPSAPEIEEVARAVVLFPNTATGFIFYDSVTFTNYVMTNHHVAEAFDDSHPVLLHYLSPRDHDGRLYVQRWLNFPNQDLAVYQIVGHPDPDSLPSLPLCENIYGFSSLSYEKTMSFDVLTVGHPRVKAQRASFGAAFYRPSAYQNTINHFAKSYPGSSGSPLWSVDHRCVVGVNMGQQTWSPTLPFLTYNVGVPINAILKQWSAVTSNCFGTQPVYKAYPSNPFARGILGESLIEQLEAQAKTIDQDQTLRRTPLMTATAPQTHRSSQHVRRRDATPRPPSRPRKRWATSYAQTKARSLTATAPASCAFQNTAAGS